MRNFGNYFFVEVIPCHFFKRLRKKWKGKCAHMVQTLEPSSVIYNIKNMNRFIMYHKMSISKIA